MRLWCAALALLAALAAGGAAAHPHGSNPHGAIPFHTHHGNKAARTIFFEDKPATSVPASAEKSSDSHSHVGGGDGGDNDKPASMFTTSYGEEVAQKLGYRNGQIELMTRPTQTGGALGLALSKGVAGGPPMLTMQWRFF